MLHSPATRESTEPVHLLLMDNEKYCMIVKSFIITCMVSPEMCPKCSRLGKCEKYFSSEAVPKKVM